LPERKWSAELGSGVTFSNVRNPNIAGYTLVPVQLSISRRLGGLHLENFAGGFFRGTSEVLINGDYTAVAHGVESYIAEWGLGGRYNFEKPGRRLVPFGELTIGLAWADAHPFLVNGVQHGLGQDFNFTFTASTGVRYDITERSYLRLSLDYSHYSNGALSEPAHSNKAIDALGPVLSFGFRF
jgi:opacity protein-like surface antigen